VFDSTELEVGLAMLALLLVVYLLFPGLFAVGPPGFTADPAMFPTTQTAAELHAEHPAWSTGDCERVARNEIWIGMTAEQAEESCGWADDVNRSVYSWGAEEQWVYRDLSVAPVGDGSYVVYQSEYSDTTYLYFESRNDLRPTIVPQPAITILRSWQD
jgi:hypothetical protein